MNNGFRVLQWAQQNKYTLTWMADQLGYSRQRLSTALHQNDISLALSKALYEQFCLRIAPIRDAERQEKVKRNKAVGERGRTPGAG